jgi:cytochrome bd-type quinol oxidase subunit 2
MADREQHSNQQLAHSASAIGAAILGFGIGAQWGQMFQPYALIAMIVGALIHVAGMVVIQMMTEPGKNDWMAKALWISAWVCLIALVLLLVYLIL